MIHITVFTPTYNRAYTLHKCYESLKRQTCKEFIWLIIDDGSTDNTKELVDIWSTCSDFEIRYHYQENQGMSGAHNTAYELIDTEINICVDSDDYMADDAIEKITTFWKQYGSKTVSGIIALNAYSDGKILGTSLPDNISLSTLNDLYTKYKCKGDKKLIYRTELAKKYPYPIYHGEKYMPLNYKYVLIDMEYKMLLMNEVVCHVEYMDDGSSKNIIKQYKNNPRGFSEYRKIYLKASKKILFRFRQLIHYVATSLISKNISFLKESPDKLMTLFAFIPGLILYLYIMKTRRSGFMKLDGDKHEKQIRILHVAGGMNAGGAETMLMHLYRKIDRRKIQFDFISFTSEKCHYDDEIRELGGRIFYVLPPGNTNLIKFVRDIYIVIKQYGPYHAVHAHTLFNSGLVLPAARMAGVKLRICHSHNTSGDYSNVMIRRIYFSAMRILIKLNATQNVACTNAAGKFLFGEKTVSEPNYHVLYNAIDLAPYSSIDQDEVNNMRSKLGIKEDTLVIGHVGKFGEQKNHTFLIRLAEYLKNRKAAFKLILIGQGNLKEQIETIVKAKNLEKYVEFMGVQRNIPFFMRMFDVFAFPSLYEGLGIVLIEAQAAGTPCVISDTVPEECDMGLGLVRRLSLNDDLDKWYEVIIKSCKIERVSSQITIGAILKKGYDLDVTVKKLTDIYGLRTVRNK